MTVAAYDRRRRVVITINYFELGTDRVKEIVVPPEDYFDLDDGEAMSVTSLPKHDLAHTYTGVPVTRLKWTVLLVVDGQEYWRVRTQFLDGHRCVMTHSSGSDGGEEIVNTTEIEPGVWHVVRTLKRPSQSWATVVNVTDFSERNANDPPPTRQHAANWTREEMMAFCAER